MFTLMLSIAGVLEGTGVTGAFITNAPSRGFSLSMRAIDIGALILMGALVGYRRRSVEAAYDLGVEIGERRGRKAGRPVLVQLPAVPLAPAHGKHERT